MEEVRTAFRTFSCTHITAIAGATIIFFSIFKRNWIK